MNFLTLSSGPNRGRLTKSLDQYFQDIEKILFNDFPNSPSWSIKSSFDYNIDENDDFVIFSLEVPGIKKDELEISIQGGKLQVKQIAKQDEENDISTEKMLININLNTSLCDISNTNECQSFLELGILTIKIPKPKKHIIDIK